MAKISDELTNNTAVLTLVARRDALSQELAGLVYGAVEVRVRDGKKYLYVHFRENGLALTKYVGEYTTELHNLILSNTVKAKALKKALKQINRELAAGGDVDSQLSAAVTVNVDFARHCLVETIYQQARLEGVATTYADTETIITGGKVNNLTADDVLKVLNLKHAWEFVLNENVISSPTNYALLCEINRLVENGFYYHAGQPRSTPVSISGTTWQPPLPIESVIKEKLNNLLNSGSDVVDKAIDLLLFVMKKQIFIDGNKRTAVIFANHFLIGHGKGLLVIPENRIEEYRGLLLAYYADDAKSPIKDFLRRYAYRAI